MNPYMYLKAVFERSYNTHVIKKNRIIVGENTIFNGKVTFSPKGKIVIGSKCVINSGARFNVIGGDIRTVFRAEGEGKITIGDNVGISNSIFIAKYSIIQIDDNVKIGGSCCFYDNDFHSIIYEQRMDETIRDPRVRYGAIHICEGAFVGAKCIVLKGVTIGKHSVVGAGSVVTKDIPDGEVWAGNPARFIRNIV